MSNAPVENADRNWPVKVLSHNFSYNASNFFKKLFLYKEPSPLIFIFLKLPVIYHVD